MFFFDAEFLSSLVWHSSRGELESWLFCLLCPYLRTYLVGYGVLMSAILFEPVYKMIFILISSSEDSDVITWASQQENNLILLHANNKGHSALPHR